MSTWQRKLQEVEAVYKAGRINRALFYLDETLKTQSEFPIYAYKCEILIKQNRITEALDVTTEVTNIDQQSPESYIKCAVIFSSFKKFAHALAIIKVGIAASKEQSQEQQHASNSEQLYKVKQDLELAERRRLSSKRDPMTILPTELMSEIVQMAIDDLGIKSSHDEIATDGYELMLRLSRVSSLWRRTLLASPGLWRGCGIIFDGSNEKSTQPFKKLDAYYQRANKTPLKDITIKINHPKEDQLPQNFQRIDHLPRNFQRFLRDPAPWLNSGSHMRSFVIYVDNSSFFFPQEGLNYAEIMNQRVSKSLNEIINAKMLKSVDEFVYLTEQAYFHLAVEFVIPIDFILTRVKKVLVLRLIELGEPSESNQNIDLASNPMPNAIRKPQSRSQHPLQHLKLQWCLTPAASDLMALFPCLKTLEMEYCAIQRLFSNWQVTDLHLPDLEVLKLLRTTPWDGFTSKSWDVTKDLSHVSSSLPNLKHCALSYCNLNVLWLLQRSTKLRYLSLCGLSAERAFNHSSRKYIDMVSFVSLSLPNLKHFALSYCNLSLLGLLQRSTQLKSLRLVRLNREEILDHSAQEYIDMFIGLFDDFNDLEELTLSYVWFSPRVLLAISRRRSHAIVKPMKVKTLSIIKDADESRPLNKRLVLPKNVNELVGAFEILSNLRELTLDNVVIVSAVLAAILRDKLCPKLRRIQVSGAVGAIDETVVSLIKQRNFTSEFASIDDFSMMACNNFKPQSTEYIREHVARTSFRA